MVKQSKRGTKFCSWGHSFLLNPVLKQHIKELIFQYLFLQDYGLNTNWYWIVFTKLTLQKIECVFIMKKNDNEKLVLFSLWNWKKVSFNQRLHLNLDSIHYVFIGCFVYFCYGINHSRVLTDSNNPPNRGSQNFRRERPNTLMLSPVPISSIPTGSKI